MAPLFPNAPINLPKEAALQQRLFYMYFKNGIKHISVLGRPNLASHNICHNTSSTKPDSHYTVSLWQSIAGQRELAHSADGGFASKNKALVKWNRKTNISLCGMDPAKDS